MKNLAWGTLPMDGVQVPVNRVSVIEASVAQQVELVIANFVRPPDDLLRLRRKALPQQRDNTINCVGVEKKVTSVAAA